MPIVDTEEDDSKGISKDWQPLYEDNLLIETAVMWYISKTPLPPSRQEMLDRDPLWDNEVAKMRHLLQYQLDGFKDGES